MYMHNLGCNFPNHKPTFAGNKKSWMQFSTPTTVFFTANPLSIDIFDAQQNHMPISLELELLRHLPLYSKKINGISSHKVKKPHAHQFRTQTIEGLPSAP